MECGVRGMGNSAGGGAGNIGRTGGQGRRVWDRVEVKETGGGRRQQRAGGAGGFGRGEQGVFVLLLEGQEDRLGEANGGRGVDRSAVYLDGAARCILMGLRGVTNDGQAPWGCRRWKQQMLLLGLPVMLARMAYGHSQPRWTQQSRQSPSAVSASAAVAAGGWGGALRRRTVAQQCPCPTAGCWQQGVSLARGIVSAQQRQAADSRM
jgi:hypothetical protein